MLERRCEEVVRAFLAGELTLFRRAKVTPVNAGLPHPLGQAAVGQSQPLGHSVATEVFSQAELHRLLLLLRGEPAPCLGWIGHQWIV